MNRLRAGVASALFALALAFALGCFGLGGPTATKKPLAPVADEPDGRAQLVTRLLEQPLGDPYFNKTLWTELQDPLPHATSAINRTKTLNDCQKFLIYAPLRTTSKRLPLGILVPEHNCCRRLGKLGEQSVWNGYTFISPGA